MKHCIMVITVLFAYNLINMTSWAGWIGPEDVVTGSWGSNPGQFYYGAGDAIDTFPQNFNVDNQNRIFINDGSGNKRIQVFSVTGSLEKIIKAPEESDDVLGWPYDIYVYPEGSFVASYDGPQKFFFDTDGNFIKKVDVYGPAYPVREGYYFYVSRTEYPLYSPTGELLSTTTERPLELGWVKERPLGGGRYLVQVEYPDRTWGIVGGGMYPKYVRDINGKLYATGEKHAARFSSCGRVLSILTLPETVTEYYPLGDGVEPVANVIEEHGTPVVAPNGDIYTWKRTPENYSILKWTWQDDANPPADVPDAPTYLTAASADNGITLTWKASLQDPGCVTDYEIARATVSGGTVSTIGTITKGILTYTDTTAEAGTAYYFKVRAKGGDGYSEYTNEASGLR